MGLMQEKYGPLVLEDARSLEVHYLEQILAISEPYRNL